MLSSLLVIEAILIACIAGGWVLGRVLTRRARARAAASAERAVDSELTDALGFVGAAFGIILGLLLVFAVQHYNDARATAREEATNAVALFHAAGPFPTAQRDAVRRDVLCTMRSITSADWAAAHEINPAGSPATSAWLQNLQETTGTLPVDTPSRSMSHEILVSEFVDLVKNRQLLLVYAQPEIPTIIWLVIFACTFAFTLLMVMHLANRKRLAIISVLTSAVVLVVIVGSLTDLDYPFAGTAGGLAPTAMETSLTTLQNEFPAVDWSPCPTAVSEQ